MDRVHPVPTAWPMMGRLGLTLFALSVRARDQGGLLSVVQGARTFDLNVIHEALDDARPVAGVLCP